MTPFELAYRAAEPFLPPLYRRLRRCLAGAVAEREPRSRGA